MALEFEGKEQFGGKSQSNFPAKIQNKTVKFQENLLNTNELQKSKIDRLINDKSSKFVNNLIEDNVNKILGKSENYPLNGILKTVNKKMNSPVQTKNISFGDVK